MKVGDYVRTEMNGIGIQLISKIKEICDEDLIFTTNGYWDKELIIKSSPNIIDLIEVGDYVNGIYIDTVEKEQKRVWYTSSYGDDDIVFYNDDIKSIVTHEQFKSMEYKVGD